MTVNKTVAHLTLMVEAYQARQPQLQTKIDELTKAAEQERAARCRAETDLAHAMTVIRLLARDGAP